MSHARQLAQQRSTYDGCLLYTYTTPRFEDTPRIRRNARCGNGSRTHTHTPYVHHSEIDEQRYQASPNSADCSAALGTSFPIAPVKEAPQRFLVLPSQDSCGAHLVQLLLTLTSASYPPVCLRQKQRAPMLVSDYPRTECRRASFALLPWTGS